MTAALLSSCSSTGPTRPVTAAPAPVPLEAPAAGTTWSRLLGQVGDDSGVSTSAALQAFVLAVGPIPGVARPVGPTGSLADGTIAVDWLLGHWSALDAAQRSAAQADLVASLPAAAPGATSTSTGPGRSGGTGRPAAAQLVSYQAAANHDRNLIAGDLGRDTDQTVQVAYSPDRTSSAAAYTVSYDAGGGFTGPAARCVVYLTPALTRGPSASSTVTADLAHQVFHCFEADDFATPLDMGRAPSWVLAGAAEWVGETIAPVSDDWWNPYLTDVAEPLTTRTYDAVGFFAHLAETGTSPWTQIDQMLEAPSSAAAYSIASDDAFRDDWASSLARQPFGPGWNTTGPGITTAAYQPPISIMGNGARVAGAVKAYANGLASVDVSADVVDVTVSNDYGRLHSADGSDHDGGVLEAGSFCVTSTCSSCPNLESMTRLAPGPMWLAVTGDSAGATYSIDGRAAVCGSCPIGTWTTTQYSYGTDGAGPLASATGGAGIEVVIDASGRMSVSLSPMGPFTVSGVPGQGSASAVGRFAGTETGQFSLPASLPATSGTFDPPVPTGVTLTYPPTGPAGSRPDDGGSQAGDPFGGPAPVAWQCSGSTMTFTSPVGPGGASAAGSAGGSGSPTAGGAQAGTHWTLTRVSGLPSAP